MNSFSINMQTFKNFYPKHFLTEQVMFQHTLTTLVDSPGKLGTMTAVDGIAREIFKNIK